MASSLQCILQGHSSFLFPTKKIQTKSLFCLFLFMMEVWVKSVFKLPFFDDLGYGIWRGCDYYFIYIDAEFFVSSYLLLNVFLLHWIGACKNGWEESSFVLLTRISVWRIWSNLVNIVGSLRRCVSFALLSRLVCSIWPNLVDSVGSLRKFMIGVGNLR